MDTSKRVIEEEKGSINNNRYTYTKKDAAKMLCRKFTEKFNHPHGILRINSKLLFFFSISITLDIYFPMVTFSIIVPLETTFIVIFIYNFQYLILILEEAQKGNFLKSG